MRFNLEKVNATLLKLELHPVVANQQASRALEIEYGVKSITASKWLDRALTFGVIELNSDYTGFQLVDQEEKQRKKEYRELIQDNVESGKVVRLHSFRVKKNQEAKKLAN